MTKFVVKRNDECHHTQTALKIDFQSIIVLFQKNLGKFTQNEKVDRQKFQVGT